MDFVVLKKSLFCYYFWKLLFPGIEFYFNNLTASKIFFLLLVFRFALAWHYLFFRLGFIEILESLSFQFSLNLENILPLFFSKIFYCSLIIDTLDILVLSHRSVKKLLIVSVPRAVNSMSFQWVSCLPLISTNTIFIQSFTWEPLYLPFNSSL